MAAYAATVTSSMRKAVKVDQVTGIGLYVGKCDITNYNSTLAELTGITGKFKALMQVVVSAISDNGYLVRWDAAANAFKAYYPTDGHTHDLLYIGGIAETEAVHIAGGDTVGKNAATNRTIAGADSATKGGVVAAAAGASVEVAADVDVGVVEFAAYGFI